MEILVGGGTNYEEFNAPISGGLKANLSIKGSSYDALVSAKVTSSLDVATQDGMPFYIVYWDKSGNIVGGANGFMPGAFPSGKTRSVSLQSSMSGPPADQYATGRIFFDVSAENLDAS